MQTEINDCGRESVTVNYAGGTKSMSAGAVLTVDLNVRTELSMGPRSGFDQVKPGNSYQVSVDIQDIRVVNQARSIRLLWHEHAYSEAAEQFRMLPRSELSTSIMASINRQQALSTAFGMWDRFLHQDAKSELSRYTKLFGKWLGPWLKTLDDLTNNNKPERQSSISFMTYGSMRSVLPCGTVSTMQSTGRIVSWNGLRKICCANVIQSTTVM